MTGCLCGDSVVLLLLLFSRNLDPVSVPDPEECKRGQEATPRACKERSNRAPSSFHACAVKSRDLGLSGTMNTVSKAVPEDKSALRPAPSGLRFAAACWTHVSLSLQPIARSVASFDREPGQTAEY